MKQLEDTRQKINEIDKDMARLFEQRMIAVEDVITYKQSQQLPVLDTDREAAVIQRNMAYIKCDAYRDSYEAFMNDVMAISRRYQKMRICKDVVGFQGTEGAFSHIASSRVFPDQKKKQYATFEDVVKAVRDKEITYGVIPFENSYTGEVGEVLDLLNAYDDIYIQGVYDLKISQNLLGLKDATLQDIKQVYSKDQAIYQSKQFLDGRGYELIPYPNTALAAEFVAKQKDKSKAAIAAKENAELYGLKVLAEDINTSNQNTTRFIILGSNIKHAGNVFSLLFTIPHKAGSLLEAMQIIANGGFNMQNIKSRSMKDRPWEYYFYVEVEGYINQAQKQNLVEGLQHVCENVKDLGSYQKESRDALCVL